MPSYFVFFLFCLSFLDVFVYLVLFVCLVVLVFVVSVCFQTVYFKLFVAYVFLNVSFTC